MPQTRSDSAGPGTRTLAGAIFARGRAFLRQGSPRSLKDLLERRRIRRSMAAPRLLAEFARQFPAATFMEIGSNDGEQHDFLKRHIAEREWTGVMVEPLPHVFERLSENYGGLARVALENVAIADHEGTMTMYHLTRAENEVLPSWYDAIGSFSREHVLSHAHAIPDIETRLVETEVRCTTVESLCSKHGISELDLLLIDTEGYDAEILKRVDLDRLSPRLLAYEHYHLLPEDRAACETRLKAHGFELFKEGFDTWCLRPDRTPGLRDLWESLEPAIPAVTANQGEA